MAQNTLAICRVVVNRTEGAPIQHDYIWELVETRALENNREWLTRAKGQLQLDLWSANTRLYDRPLDKGLLVDKESLEAAIDKIEGLL